MSPDDLSADDKAILAELLRATIAADRFFMSPRVKSLKAILVHGLKRKVQASG
jgi:hypothetical protein